MAVLNNFYVVLGIILVLVFVLGARGCGNIQKIGILLAFTLVLLWLEKPDWVVLLLWKVGVHP